MYSVATSEMVRFFTPHIGPPTPTPHPAISLPLSIYISLSHPHPHKRTQTERAYRCGVCQTPYSLAPPDPRFTHKLFQSLRALGGIACIATLAFGLAPPFPHIALLVILLLLATRSHGMLALVLLAAGSVAAALHAKGMRLLLRVDDGGRFGLAIVRHGAPVPGLGLGTLLVASDDLEHSIFKRSVVLIYEHGPHGARGVILNQPLTNPNGFLSSDDDGSGSDASTGGSGSSGKVDEANATYGGGGGGGGGGGSAVQQRGKKAAAAAAVAAVVAENAVHHRLGGPVGMPGDGARQEIAVLHTVEGVEGALAVISGGGGGGGGGKTLFVGGRLADVLEGNKQAIHSRTSAGVRGWIKSKTAFSSTQQQTVTTPSPPTKGHHQQNTADDHASESTPASTSSSSSTDTTSVRKRGGSTTTTTTSSSNNNNKHAKSTPPSPIVLVFHGISTWAEGQLEGEIRAHAWAYGDAGLPDILHTAPEELWERLVASDRVTVLN